MLSIYKNDFFTTFTQPKNPFVIFQKPGADSAEDLIYTDKNPFVIGTSFTPAISLHLGQFHLCDANHYSAILNLYTPLCLVNSLTGFTLKEDTGFNDSKIFKVFWSKSLHLVFRSTKLFFFPQVCGLYALMSSCNFKSCTFKTIKPGLSRLFYWKTS